MEGLYLLLAAIVQVFLLYFSTASMVPEAIATHNSAARANVSLTSLSPPFLFGKAMVTAYSISLLIAVTVEYCSSVGLSAIKRI
eukprot:13333766-Ditylum_brightwellii.AAC.1